MFSNQKEIFAVGDWIKAESNQGELIHGYIETLNPFQEKVEVQVVVSDNNETIGKKVKLYREQIKKLPTSTPNNKEQIRSLIDVALAAKDKEWFMELTKQLNEIQQDSKQNNTETPADSEFSNQLGQTKEND
ncbi:IDEAL domain-containing protein [Halalkalibacter nanhaiisediminis]|uniref:IDEAL domain-containing protein n=1 Tax=Halalkalibacter nanhaiisediminis TaxID=688079 RepID=A0A562QN08_9BACI|nr:IDEAL domain-containing protein [Halalkalibacter nanhaiisediminis]TWI58142.1 IDEAL domain-containing protein [Halalkalibacter nanhaiisediminis]